MVPSANYEQITRPCGNTHWLLFNGIVIHVMVALMWSIAVCDRHWRPSRPRQLSILGTLFCHGWSPLTAWVPMQCANLSPPAAKVILNLMTKVSNFVLVVFSESQYDFLILRRLWPKSPRRIIAIFQFVCGINHHEKYIKTKQCTCMHILQATACLKPLFFVP